MTTVLQYLVVAAVIGLLLFGLALLLFGRGERLAALPARTSPAQLPEHGIEGADVRRVRFALAVRGYRMSDVDWTLERLADELDRTRHRLAEVSAAADAIADRDEVRADGPVDPATDGPRNPATGGPVDPATAGPRNPATGGPVDPATAGPAGRHPAPGTDATAAPTPDTALHTPVHRPSSEPEV